LQLKLAISFAHGTHFRAFQIMRRALPFIIVIVVAVGTAVGATLLYRAKKPATFAAASTRSTSSSTGGAHMRGYVNAPVTLDEYGDYECPPCGKLAEPLKKLESDYGDKVRVIFHHFPLPVHAHAMEAACAAEAAASQGKFWEMHDLIYKEQTNWSSKAADARKMFLSFAGMLGLDVDRFTRDMDSEAIKERVQGEHEKGASIGVKSTPSIFINNKYVLPGGEDPTKPLRQAIDEALNANPESKDRPGEPERH
jgi:protein-disulfide isomerase